MISLLFFVLLARCIVMYISYVPEAPYAFNDISITYKKKYMRTTFTIPHMQVNLMMF
jgi:hypothetical protein